MWLSGYINGNAEIHRIAEAEKYPWSSYHHFLGIKEDKLIIDKGIILEQFSSINLEGSKGKRREEEYKKFVKTVIEESEKRKDLEKYLLEKI